MHSEISTYSHFAAVPPDLLGIEAKSVDPVSAESGIQDAAGGVAGPAIEARRRFRLLRGAAGLLWEKDLDWKEQHRTVGCHRHIGDAAFGIEIRRRTDGGGARMVGLHTCGSIWACPVCAQKISHTRRDELRAANAEWLGQGGATYLVTLTFPHERHVIGLRDMVEKMLDAARSWGNSKSYRKFLGTAKNPGKYERHGSVKAVEVTWGAHGWHPHIHIVLFAKTGMQDDVEAVGALKDAWIAAVMKTKLAGRERLNDMLLHSFDFQAGKFVADYIAKFGREPAPTSRQIDALKSRWGIHSEATSFVDKVGHVSHGDYIGLTPFGLLADAVENGDAFSGGLFREYAAAFEGKRQLTWSPGLKKSLRVAELEDEEIAKGERKMPEEEHVIRIFKEEWSMVLKHDARDARFLLCHVAAKYGREGVERLLELFKEARPTNQGKFNELYSTRFH